MSTPSRNRFVRVLQYIWVFPNSLIGLFVGLIGLLSGGSFQLKQGCIEFYGGLVTWLLKRIGFGTGVLAMTLGHIIIGQDRAGLRLARKHEQVHVRQYERWGLFFIPAYLICSLCLWFRKKDSYRDNPFEVEAYRVADPHHREQNDKDSTET